MDDKKTPSYRRASPYHLKLNQAVFCDRDALSVIELGGAAITAAELISLHAYRDEHDVMLKYITERLERAYCALQEVVAQCPEVADRARLAADSFESALSLLAAGLTGALIDRDMPRITPLAEINTRKNAVQKYAQERASELWAADADEEYRMKEMAALVKGILEREGFKGLPNLGGIARWIKPIAPKHASQGGRPSNNPKPRKKTY